MTGTVKEVIQSNATFDKMIESAEIATDMSQGNPLAILKVLSKAIKLGLYIPIIKG